MASAQDTVTNGVDVSALEDAIEAIDNNPAAGMFTFQAATEWTESLKSVTTINELDHAGETVSTRELTVESDEPEQILGERTAPNAVELLLTALGSCLSVGYAAHAAAMEIEIDKLDIEMHGDVDLRGFLGISEDVRPGYDSVHCTVSIDANASEEEIQMLREQVESTSPLMDNISNTVELETELSVSGAE